MRAIPILKPLQFVMTQIHQILGTHLVRAVAQAVVDVAHQPCPCSMAARRNIYVILALA